MPGIDFHVVCQSITMLEVLTLLGFEPSKRSGSQIRGACPVHLTEPTRSRTFSVNIERGRYQCFQCGSRGNQLELWAAVHKLTIYSAAIDLCEAVGRDVPWLTRS